MKILQILFIILVICISNTNQAQTTDTSKAKNNMPKNDNLMDMQAEFLTGMFGENLDGESQGKTLSFLELLDKMDIPAEQKAEYKNWYYLQAKELTQKQKDSLGKAIEKKIMEAERD